MPAQFSSTASTLLALALAVAGAIALAWGSVVILRRGDRKKGLLMAVCALVILGNVLIWTL